MMVTAFNYDIHYGTIHDINYDINHDYKTQRNKIRQRRGNRSYPFTYGDYVIKLMMGSIVRELDHLDEFG